MTMGEMFTHPEWVSSQGSHHSQKQGLLKESEHSRNQRLHACEAAKLRRWIPAGKGVGILVSHKK